MRMWWSLQLRREPASVPLARRLLMDALHTAGVEGDTSYELSVALSEACANAVEHGTGERSRAYRVTAYLDGDRCRIEVADTGPGFPGSSLPEPNGHGHCLTDAEYAESGRGLFLIESLTEDVRCDNRPGSGAVISFDKTLT